MKTNLIENTDRISGKYVLAKQTDNYRYSKEGQLVGDTILVNMGDVILEKDLVYSYNSIFDLARNADYKTVVVEIFRGKYNSIDDEEVIRIINDVVFKSFRYLKVYILVDHIDTRGSDIDIEKIRRDGEIYARRKKEEMEEKYTVMSNYTYGLMTTQSSNIRRREKNNYKYEELIKIWLEGKNITKEELCEKSGIHIDDYNSYSDSNLPPKDEILSMAMALGSNVKETEQLLESAKYKLDLDNSRDKFIIGLINDGKNINKSIEEINKVLNKANFDSI